MSKHNAIVRRAADDLEAAGFHLSTQLVGGPDGHLTLWAERGPLITAIDWTGGDRVTMLLEGPGLHIYTDSDDGPDLVQRALTAARDKAEQMRAMGALVGQALAAFGADEAHVGGGDGR